MPASGIGYLSPVAQLNSTARSPGADPPVGDRLLVGGIGRRALGAEQQALLRRDLAPGLGDRLVVDRDREAAALAHRAQDQKIADRLRHPDAGGEGVRVLPARRVLDARLPRP